MASDHLSHLNLGRALALAALIFSCQPTLAARFEGQIVNNQFYLTDTVSNRQLIVGNFPMYVLNGVTPTVTMIQKNDGVDITYTFTNNTGSPQDLGWLVFSGIQFGPNMTWWNFSNSISSAPFGGYAVSKHASYPGEIYSPVMVFGDNQHTVGISLLFPAVEYDHHVRAWMVGANGVGPTFSGRFSFEKPAVSGIYPPVKIPNNTTRTYTVAIRVALPGEHWLKTLLPYRDYFRSKFGSAVDYTRDPRPIAAELVTRTLSPVPSDNLRQYRTEANLRVDVDGWSGWADSLLTRYSNGYRRGMLWTASGLLPDPSYDFAFNFMTPITDLTVANATLEEMKRVEAGGMKFGWWWGHASSIPTVRGFPGLPSNFIEANVNDATAVSLALQELDMALQRTNASFIGLDAYSFTNLGQGYHWAKLLKSHAQSVRGSEVKFTGELAICDAYHHLMATYYVNNSITGPDILADFLNPGHESWVQVNSYPSGVVTDNEKFDYLRLLAAWGYTPIMFGGQQIPTDISAAESWLTYVPRPTGVISSPSTAESLSGQVTIRGRATTNMGTLVSARFLLDGSALSPDLTGPGGSMSWDLEYVFDANQLANGTHSLALEVTDSNGFTEQGSAVAVRRGNLSIIRETYAYPSPSSGRPRLRLQTTAPANSASWKINNLAGMQIAGGTFGSPTQQSDGSWLYEQQWQDAGIPSGIYLLTTVASVSGRATETKTARIALVK